MSSILETFLIMFDSNADQVKKDAGEAEKATNDLDKKINQSNNSSIKLGSSFMRLATAAAGAIAAFASVGAIARGINDAANYADHLNDVSQALGINISDLDAWGHAAKLSGGSADGLQQSLGNLVTSFAQISTLGKSRASPFFKELGISMKDARGNVRQVMDVLPELADRFQKLTKAQAFGMGQKLGLDQGTILLLQQGRRAVEDLVNRQKELGVVTKHDAEIAAKFNDAWDDTAHVFRSTFMAIGGTVLPVLTGLLEKIQGVLIWLRTHNTQVKAFGYSLAIVAGIISASLVPALYSLLGALIPIAVPLITIAALFSGLYLVVEDFFNYLEGKPSVVGKLFADYPIILDFAREFGRAFSDVIGWIDTAIEKIGQLFGWFGKVTSLFGGNDMTINAVQQGQKSLAFAASNPIAAQTSNSISNSRTSSQRNNTMNVQSVVVNTQATDADGIAGAFTTSLSSQYRQATSNFDDGVEY